MEHLKIRYPVLAIFLLMSFTACETVDFDGMFISDKSVNKRFEQSMNWNVRTPFRELLVTGEHYTLLSMGDSHVGTTSNLDSLLNYAILTNAAAVVMVGDLTTGQAEDYSLFRDHLPEQEILSTFQVVGNHDLYFNGWDQFFSTFGSSSYIFTVKTPLNSDLYICLDSGSGTLGNKQLDWFKNILQELRPEYRHCVVFTHNNLFRNRHTFSTNPLVEELHVLLELFTIHQVDMVITGHDHQHYDDVFGNTTHIVMDALKDGVSNSGFFQLNINEGNLEYQFMIF
ncbi:MAG: metallophosphoesterase [Bacteroidales bacterium]|nr:metallophosphoesterase [Bacteroidales bacterium]